MAKAPGREREVSVCRAPMLGVRGPPQVCARAAMLRPVSEGLRGRADPAGTRQLP